MPDPTYFMAQGGGGSQAGAFADGAESIAAGEASLATGVGATALGAGANAIADKALAVGHNALAHDTHSIALGTDAKAEALYSMALGPQAKVVGLQGLASGYRSHAFGVAASAVGGFSQALGRMSAAFGYDAMAGQAASTALGGGAAARAPGSVALGANSVADRASTVSLGRAGAERQIVHLARGTEPTDAVNVAQLQAQTAAFRVRGDGLAQALGIASTAVGAGSYALGEGSAGVGADARAEGSGALALGRGAHALGLNSVAVGAGARALPDAIVSFGNGDGIGGPAERRLVNVAAGQLAAGSREAVNGGQLFDAMKQLRDAGYQTVSEALAANADANTLGANARAASTDGLAAGRDANAAAVAGTALGAGSRVESSATRAVALGAGSVAERDATVSVGSAGAERQVVNVAAGTRDTDAVNKAQLDGGITRANRYTDQRHAALADSFQSYQHTVDDRFRQQDQRIDQQGAMNAAMLNMATSAAGIRTQNRVGVGIGFQGGESALSLGYQRALSERATVTVGGAISGDNRSVGLGAGFGW